MNQSHYFQHQGSTGDSMSITTGRNWAFGTTTHNFYITNSMYPTSGVYEQDFALGVDGNSYIQSACLGHSLVFNVFNPITMRAWLDVDPTTNANLFLSGSAQANCGPQRWWN